MKIFLFIRIQIHVLHEKDSIKKDGSKGFQISLIFFPKILNLIPFSMI